MKAHRICLTLSLLAAATGAAAQATITHEQALAGNVTPGDAPGYPVTISVPGHYVLKGNLQVPLNTGGIVITTSGVTLDLNGFSIAGPGACTRHHTLYVSCNQFPLGNTSLKIQMAGISSLAATAHLGNTVRNGTVRGFRGYGIYAYGATVESVVLRENRSSGFAAGIYAGQPSRISGSRIYFNGEHGVDGHYVVFERSSATYNGGHGLSTGGSQVIDSVLTHNGLFGISSTGNLASIMRGTRLYPNEQGGWTGSVLSQGGNHGGGALF
ncbi:MAG: right-handed parallel beta-helix repeat-containing protein [Rubrivivax sp.]|nr:right-handed parallel beta-helix repeat-containing protein [Rubrivivax sp.]